MSGVKLILQSLFLLQLVFTNASSVASFMLHNTIQFTPLQTAHNAGYVTRRYRLLFKKGSKSALKVSEVHIPAYRQSKLPFLWNPDEDEDHLSVKSAPLTQVESFTFPSFLSYSSMIAFQDGHLVHKSNAPVLTPEECQCIIEEAETICASMGWTTNRHGNYP